MGFYKKSTTRRGRRQDSKSRSSEPHETKYAKHKGNVSVRAYKTKRGTRVRRHLRRRQFR